MAFSKNWKQIVVSKGEPFQIEYLDRKFGGRPVTVFEVTDEGVVEVNGTELVGAQAIVGDVTVTGSVTASVTVQGADVIATDDLTVGDALSVGGISTFTGLAKLPAASFFTVVHAGRNLAGVVTLTGAKVGDLVIGAAQIGVTPGDAKAKFETTITVADQIQQTSATDLSAEEILFVLLHQS